MAYTTFQEIFQGPAQILVGTAATNYYNSAITDAINKLAGFTATETALTVDNAATLCPDIAAAAAIADPPVLNIISATRTGEVMWAYSKDDTSPAHIINVIRGCGIHFTKYDKDSTQFNAALVDNDELQLLGKLTFPKRSSDMVITASDSAVSIRKTQATFPTEDSFTGKANLYSSESALYEVEFSVPRNTIPSTMNKLGFARVTDGNSPAKYMLNEGPSAAGQELNAKVLVIIPNEVLTNIADYKQTIGADDYLDITERVHILFNAKMNPEFTYEYQQGNQINIACKFTGMFSPVFQSAYIHGGFKDMCRAFETV